MRWRRRDEVTLRLTDRDSRGFQVVGAEYGCPDVSGLIFVFANENF